MKPVDFAGANLVLGKHQPQYQPLPVLRLTDEQGTVISCWELDENDLILLNKNKKLYLSQLTFGGIFQPQLPTSYKPLEVTKAEKESA